MQAGCPSSRVYWLMLDPMCLARNAGYVEKAMKSTNSLSLLQIRRLNSLTPRKMAFFKIHKQKIVYSSMISHLINPLKTEILCTEYKYKIIPWSPEIFNIVIYYINNSRVH